MPFDLISQYQRSTANNPSNDMKNDDGKLTGLARRLRAPIVLSVLLNAVACMHGAPFLVAQAEAAETRRFHVEEATIEDVQRAIKSGQVTATQLVTLYMERIKAYNGTCVNGAVDPATGLQLGVITPIPNAGQIDALMTLNIRGKRSRTDPTDNSQDMPDALETARKLDAEFARTGKLVGPLHGIPFAIKDQFDTFDMRTTSGSVVNYANDRPPRDSEVVARLRKAGAIILAKSNMGEYASGDRSTYGGSSCNPYDTTRSPGRSSGGAGAAVAANLVMCAIGEETGPSARNPAANNSLVGIVATYSLISRAGLIPASLTRDRPGILCRTTRDAATVLGALAGYDAKDQVTAESVGRLPREPYKNFADGKSLKGMRIGVVRELMQPATKADEDSVRITNQAIADLAKAGAVVVDPGPNGQLFKEAINQIIPALDSPTLTSLYKELFLGDAPQLGTLLDLSSNPAKLPTDAIFRMLVEGEPTAPGEARYVMDRYLHNRGDRNIQSMNDLIEKATFFTHPPVDGVSLPPKARLEASVFTTQKLTRKSDGTPVVVKKPITTLDVSGWHARRAVLQMLVFKVMADNKLDALVYPTKTVPPPILGAPVEPTTLKSVSEKTEVMVDGVPHIRTVQRVVDTRAATAWRFSPNSGLPAIAVPAGFTREVYDRAPVVASDGSIKAGELVGPKPIALPVAIEFLGRPYSEPVLLGIASGYEKATHHRLPPAGFPPLPDVK
ncbi:MAG: amidase [Herminiimonas sp.]|nr:amidase [Herminiimonas sp.]